MINTLSYKNTQSASGSTTACEPPKYNFGLEIENSFKIGDITSIIVCLVVHGTCKKKKVKIFKTTKKMTYPNY